MDHAIAFFRPDCLLTCVCIYTSRFTECYEEMARVLQGAFGKTSYRAFIGSVLASEPTVP